MRKNVTDRLKSSLENERKTVMIKSIDRIDARFVIADKVFDKNIKVVKGISANEKINVVRDTFTLPEKDYRLIDLCKTKLLENKISVTKSEIIRAGLIKLSKLSDNELISSLKNVEKIKTGRPKNN